MDNTFISRLEWRFATKQFDASKKVSEGDIADIKKAIRFAPTSYGLQPFRVYDVQDAGLREKIRQAAYNQSQVTDASHFFIFAVRTNAAGRVKEYEDLVTGGSEEAKAAMAGYFQMIEGFVSSLQGDAIAAWCAKQMYIALGFALAACAEKGIDSCPMEGFDPAAVTALLELPENENAMVMLTIGYRAEDSKYPKVRFSQDDLFGTK